MIVLVVIVSSSVFASLTDWLFMDVLVHRYYRSMPEIWRPRRGAARIVTSEIVGAMASAAVVLLCWLDPGRPALMASVAWLAGPLPVILQNVLWIRMHPAVAAGHAMGWLTRLLIAAESAAWLLPH